MITEFKGTSERVDSVLIKLDKLNDIGLISFFENARDRGELQIAPEPRHLARHVNTFFKGLAVARKAGSSPKAQRDQIDFFVDMLVTSKSALKVTDLG